MIHSSLWTKNFTIITLGTLVSAIGGVAMNLALSLVVFDQTGSTWLSGLFGAIGMLPGVLLPALISPLVDRLSRKRLIVGLDLANGVLYLCFLLWIRYQGFQYGAYLLFTFLTGCIGAVYSLTFQCFYPQLIPAGQSQRGYAVSAMIYPLTTTLVTPLAAVVYDLWGIQPIFLLEGLLLLLAAAMESRIDAPLPVRNGEPSEPWLASIKEGVAYLRREKGVRSIYGYMAVTNAAGNGVLLMAMAYFQSVPALGAGLYALLVSAETIGRTVGAAVHYLFRISEERRYWLTVRVYLIYELCDGAMLFLCWPLMVAVRFLCGFLGVNTATLREAAVQRYLPDGVRGRVNGLFQLVVSLGLLLSQMLAGALGEWLPYPVVAALLAGFSLVALWYFILRRRMEVRGIYNLPDEDH